MFNFSHLSLLSLYWFTHAYISYFLLFLLCFCLLVLLFGSLFHQLNYFVTYDSFELECLWTFFPLVFIILMSLPLIFYDHQFLGDVYHFTAEQWFFSMSHILPTASCAYLMSQDVLHAFYIPEIWVKMDIVPGTITPISLYFPFIGVYRIFCAQICGTNHSLMCDYVLII